MINSYEVEISVINDDDRLHGFFRQTQPSYAVRSLLTIQVFCDVLLIRAVQALRAFMAFRDRHYIKTALGLWYLTCVSILFCYKFIEDDGGYVGNAGGAMKFACFWVTSINLGALICCRVTGRLCCSTNRDLILDLLHIESVIAYLPFISFIQAPARAGIVLFENTAGELPSQYHQPSRGPFFNL